MNNITNFSGLVSLRGHHFYASLINHNSIVVDLGSHLGQFSHQVSSLAGCQCYAIEALPSLYAKIPETPLVKKFNYAISLSNQPVKFGVSDNPEYNHIDKWSVGNVIETITVEGISLETFMQNQHLQSIDLLKVDIEGAEIELFQSLSDASICKIKQITVEFHDFVFPIAREVEIIKNRLKNLGFYCIVFSRKNNGDVLFLNRKYCDIPIIDSIYIRFFAKYLRGISRIVSRLLDQQ
ncbi:MAG: FkbM family methyltransferase [Fischerella sp.]|jgi:FkbM family methyltransferase|uniref:FkbM family methyltransferase n=1 Tax=Fischerella sp. TaxID=1191 RepID=UPI0017F34E15|nr:FkbM family methyltransferase [Fischerella sp.]NWF61053.1 FkbM family methyltransferase [Fischerella sp.]